MRTPGIRPTSRTSSPRLAALAAACIGALFALGGCAGTASTGWAQTADAIEPQPATSVLFGVRDGDTDVATRD